MVPAKKLFRKYSWNKSSGPPILIDFLSSHFSYHSKEEWLRRIQEQVLCLESCNPLDDLDQRLFIKVNGEWVLDPSRSLKQRDIIETACDGSKEPQVATKYEILHHDEHILVVLKPSNIPVSPGGRYFYNTLGELIMRTYTPLNGKKLYTVHRLDKETSGIVLFALDKPSAKLLSSAGWYFKKRYEAVVSGIFPENLQHLSQKDVVHIRYAIANGQYVCISEDTLIPSVRKIRMYATRAHAADGVCTCVSVEHHNGLKLVSLTCPNANGSMIFPWQHRAKASHTKMEIHIRDNSIGLNLISCRLETGRTHQIRVHVNALGSAASIGSKVSVLGDKLYGQTDEQFLQLTRGENAPMFKVVGEENTSFEEIDSHLLHANEISFRHPATKDILTFTASALDTWKKHPSALVRKFLGT